MLDHIVLASRNAKKTAELRDILAPRGIRLSASPDYPQLADVAETGETFAENAALKAEYTARMLGLPALGDDSGLEVEALGGEPGVYSARYAGEGADDAANNRLLLEKLAKLAREGKDNRRARFVCVLAFSVPGEKTRFYRGETCGIIAASPRGEGGFGYDPLFISDDLGLSFAEAGAEQKHRVSHRGRALAQFMLDIKNTQRIS